MSLNTTNIFVRFGLFVAFGFMAPIGVVVIVNAFEVGQPHIFVMLIFSGSLTTLVGLACLVGFISSFFIPEPSGSEVNYKPDTTNLPLD